MEMNEIKERIVALSEEYEFKKDKIYEYYNILMQYPVIRNSDIDTLSNCLEMIISERISNQIMIEQNSLNSRSVKETINEMVRRVYGDIQTDVTDDKHLRFQGYDLEPEIPKRPKQKAIVIKKY